MSKKLISLIVGIMLVFSMMSIALAEETTTTTTTPAPVTISEPQINSDTQSYKKADFKVTITFSKDLQGASVNDTNVTLKNSAIGDGAEAEAPIYAKLDATNKKMIVVTLKKDLDQNTKYVLTVSNIKDSTGKLALESEYSWDILTSEEEIAEITSLNPVTSFKGQALSPTRVKWTWVYSKDDTKKIDGFEICDEEDQVIARVESTAKEYTELVSKPGAKYSRTIKAFNKTESDNPIYSEETKTSITTPKLNLPPFTEKSVVAKVSGKDIRYYWDYSAYKDMVENFSDYIVKVYKDNTLKGKPVAQDGLSKKTVVEKNAVAAVSTKNNLNITRWIVLVNKATNESSKPFKKVVTIEKTQAPVAPRVTIDETDIDQGYLILKVKDMSTNEVKFNFYYYTKDGQKKPLPDENGVTYTLSQTTEGVGQIYAFKVVGYDSDKYYGFTVTSVSADGTESKESERADVTTEE